MEGIIKKLYRRIYKLFIKSVLSTSVSDNKIYPSVCLKAANNYRYFNRFRRNPLYREILEHVSEELGLSYLKEIKKTPTLLGNMDSFKTNDKYGTPFTYHYPEVGDISPTTLRYVKVLGDLLNLFKELNNLNICEIGVGYGGQCRIINAYCSPSHYQLVDIQSALQLAKRYLDNYIMEATLTFCTMNELEVVGCDLVISNYAFTELRREVQKVYLNKIILNSRSGYITYNEAPPDFNCYKWQELLEIIPGSRRLEEIPLSHPSNCIIVWGDK